MQRSGSPSRKIPSASRAKAQRRTKGARGKDYAPNNLAVIIVLAVVGGLIILPALVWLSNIAPQTRSSRLTRIVAPEITMS